MAKRGPRSKFYDGEGAIPDSRIEELKREFGIGYWSMRFFELYGSKDIIEFNYKRCEHATDFNTARKTGKPIIPEPPPREATKQKLTRPLSGHVSFSPILPPDGKAAISFYHAAKAYCVTFSFE